MGGKAHTLGSDLLGEGRGSGIEYEEKVELKAPCKTRKYESIWEGNSESECDPSLQTLSGRLQNITQG